MYTIYVCIYLYGREIEKGLRVTSERDFSKLCYFRTWHILRGISKSPSATGDVSNRWRTNWFLLWIFPASVNEELEGNRFVRRPSRFGNPPVDLVNFAGTCLRYGVVQKPHDALLGHFQPPPPLSAAFNASMTPPPPPPPLNVTCNNKIANNK